VSLEAKGLKNAVMKHKCKNLKLIKKEIKMGSAEKDYNR